MFIEITLKYKQTEAHKNVDDSEVHGGVRSICAQTEQVLRALTHTQMHLQCIHINNICFGLSGQSDQ